MDEGKQGDLRANPGGAVRSKTHGPHAVQGSVEFAGHLDALRSGIANLIKERTRLNSRFSADLISAPIEDIPAAIPSLIDAAVAVLDADRDSSRRYLLRASAILRVIPRRTEAESATRSESRGGLLAWQLNRIVDYIETRLPDKITVMALARLVNVSVSQLFRSFKISVGVSPCQYIAWRRVELACTMIRASGEPLSQVAVACGLCDQAHLCKVFRRTIGISPSAWRRAISPPDPAH